MANHIFGILSGLYGPGPSVTVSGSLPGLEGDLAGDQYYSAISAELSGLEGLLTGMSDRVAYLSGSLPGLGGLLSGTSGSTVQVSGTLSGLSGSLTATAHKIAFISGTLSGLDGLLTGYVVPVGTISGTISGLSGLPGALEVLGSYAAISMNLSNRSVTEYLNYSFDSFFEFNGVIYGVKNSIYSLEGTTDAGTAIAIAVSGGSSKLAVDSLKSVSDLFLLTNLNGSCGLSLYQDDKVTGQSYIATGDGVVGNKRFKASLGITGHNWRWRITNTSGAAMDIRRVEVRAAALKRRR